MATLSPSLTTAPAVREASATDRRTAALLLLVIAGTHLVLVPDHLEEAPYAGGLFLALGVVGVALAGLLLVRDSALGWLLAGGVAALTVVAFVVSRTFGLPELGDDVGNWAEPLSFPALAAELMLVGLAVTVRRAHRLTRPAGSS